MCSGSEDKTGEGIEYAVGLPVRLVKAGEKS